MKKTVCVCDKCGKQEFVNLNFRAPNDWIIIDSVVINGVCKIDEAEFCNKECLIAYIKLAM